VAEPEEVITEAAHFATTRARALWSKRRPSDAPPRLADYQRRLELLVAALFEHVPPIVAERPAPLPLLARLALRGDRTKPGVPLASTDGARLRLPPELPRAAALDAAARYRLLALEQAARAQRGTPAVRVDDSLVRDLYALAEAAAVDRLLAELTPGLAPDLAAARAEALRERPALRMTPIEAAVERLVAALLGADAAQPPAVLSSGDSPRDSLAWARAMASHLGELGGRYRGVGPVALWGTQAPKADAAAPAAVGPVPDASSPRPHRSHTMTRRPRAREARPDEDDARMGTWIVRADDPQESVEDPMGLQRPVDQDAGADPEDVADSLSDLREARLVRTPGVVTETLASDEPVPRAPAPRTSAVARPDAIQYPEWDYRIASYRADGALVRETDGRRGDPRWAEQALARHRPLVRLVRRDFERLRPTREKLRRQRDGSDIDVDGWVTQCADLRAGVSPDDGCYLEDRRARRDTAVLLLVDASASTDAWVAGSQRIIDVERDAVLIVNEALTALGDRHAIFAFRGEGARRVDVLPLKRFTDVPGPAVRARIGALEPDGFTRVGAAIRHATALLAREAATYRLLLLLSDGRPNDVDIYDGTYGLEDTRQAFAEARQQAVQAFCLTVDREAPSYASHVFGRHGHAVLRDAQRLPQQLVQLLRRLVHR
jgi:nitric oxide reductase NorD protein